MRKNSNKKQIAFINFYKLNDQGQIIYAYGDKASIVANLNEGTMYEVNNAVSSKYTQPFINCLRNNCPVPGRKKESRVCQLPY